MAIPASKLTPGAVPALTLSRIDAVPSPRFPRRFRARVFFYIAALAIGFSVAFTGVFYWRQLGFIEHDRVRRANTLLTSLATEAELGAYAGDAALCALPARRTMKEDDVLFVAIYDRRLHEIMRYSRQGVSVPLPSPEGLSPAFDAERALGPIVSVVSVATGDAWDDLYTPIITLSRDSAIAIASPSDGPEPRQEVVGVARIGLSRHLIRAQLRETLVWGLWLGTGILAVGLAAAYLISRRVSRPIAALIRGADQLRAGDLETRVKIESRDELGQLAYSFNRMARRLNESITALESLNRDLEVEVERRTVEVQRTADFSALLTAPLGRHDADQILARLLDDALAALLAGTGAIGAGVFLLAEADPTGPRPLALVRYHGAVPDRFDPAPEIAFLEVGLPFLDGRRIVVPLLLGADPLGCVVLLGLPGRDEHFRFLAQAASQLAIAVGNVRAYAAADRLARALEQRNTALAKQRDQLQEMNRLKSEFLANISHELRTPLNAIIGYCELIADGIYGTVNLDQTSALAGIDESGKNLLSLINQILDLAKVESGKMTVYLETVDLDEVARSVIAEAAAIAKDRPYRVSLSGTSGLRLRTDGAKVKQILTNLVSNAVKFTLKGRVDVTIRAEADGGCSVAVTDTGIGIKPADMEIIFEEFRQADGSPTREFGGTGLGLAIAQRFAVLLGGRISVESRPGQGSTFKLRLPVEPPAPSPRAHARARLPEVSA